ncbi:hypothetical protein [Stappia stellulata]|uniref:hypothetical protein n=1 Tax=Stappia stellulata TaxID=71235 RepID=UPI0003FEDD88|nr:hypothetical protein [Stappia stellulata]
MTTSDGKRGNPETDANAAKPNAPDAKAATPAETREARLAAALRANLRKRKAAGRPPSG